jgi:hypothetical protein
LSLQIALLALEKTRKWFYDPTLGSMSEYTRVLWRLVAEGWPGIQNSWKQKETPLMQLIVLKPDTL